jgi:hypothetical protein
MLYHIDSNLPGAHGLLIRHGEREYGLPLVSNIENVTFLLKNGEPIEMNGTTGEIRLLS